MRATIAVGVALVALVNSVAPTHAAPTRTTFVEITGTADGARLALEGAARISADGVPTDPSAVHVWELGPGEYLVATDLPVNFKTTRTETADGLIRTEVRYDVEADAASNVAASSLQRARIQLAAKDAGSVVATSGPYWSWLSQYCFARLSNGLGWLDTCYVIHKLVGETDSTRDYYQLEQYGTAGAWQFGGKIYDAWVAAQKAAGSSTMSWIDWNPRSNINHSCFSISVSVAALGVSISSPAILCEQWIITKWAEAGHFKLQWSCGCIWTLSAGFTAL